MYGRVFYVPISIISYNFQNRDSAETEELAQLIMTLGEKWWHRLDSMWLVQSELSAAEIRNTLLSHMAPGTEILVVTSMPDAAWSGFTDIAAEWLETNFASDVPTRKPPSPNH